MPMFASTLGGLQMTGTNPKLPHAFVKLRTKAGGSGRRPRTGKAAAAGPDPFEPLRRLARAESMDEVNELWEGLRLAELRRAAILGRLGRDAMAVARVIDESPVLATKEARRKKAYVIDVLAGIAVAD